MKDFKTLLDAICAEMHIDEEDIRLRKMHLGLTAEEEARLRDVHDRLEDFRGRFLDELYDGFLRFPPTAALLGDEARVRRLKQSQGRYFDTLTGGDYSWDYVRNRLLVGAVHHHVGLDTKWYLGAYSKYVIALLHYLGEIFDPATPEYRDVMAALIKIIFLDMGLAMDAYLHAGRMNEAALRAYSESLMANTPCGMLVLAQDLRVISANPAARRLLQLYEDVEGLALDSLFPVDEVRQLSQAAWQDGHAGDGAFEEGLEAGLAGAEFFLGLAQGPGALLQFVAQGGQATLWAGFEVAFRVGRQIPAARRKIRMAPAQRGQCLLPGQEDADHLCGGAQQPDVFTVPLPAREGVVETDEAMPLPLYPHRQHQEGQDGLGGQGVPFRCGESFYQAGDMLIVAQLFHPARKTAGNQGEVLQLGVVDFRFHAGRAGLVGLAHAQAVTRIVEAFKQIGTAHVRGFQQVLEGLVQGRGVVTEQGLATGGQFLLQVQAVPQAGFVISGLDRHFSPPSCCGGPMPHPCAIAL